MRSRFTVDDYSGAIIGASATLESRSPHQRDIQERLAVLSDRYLAR